jgi:hypothetical protein
MQTAPYHYVFVPVALALIASLGVNASLASAQAQRTSATSPIAEAPPPPYADVADLVLKSSVIVDVTIQSVERLKNADAVDLAPGMARLLVTADVHNLLRGPDVLPPQITYLFDVATDPKGHIPRLKKARVMLFARPVAGRPNQVQLTGSTSQQDWTSGLDLLTRRIAADVVSPTAPPVVTGIGNAFHVPGSLPGEGETQIFLTTADGRPVSLSVLRRPGEQTRWAVALSEIVDEAAAPPAPDTLLWYRLACFLPDQLPEKSLASNDADNAAAAREDYRFVLRSLGRCNRT